MFVHPEKQLPAWREQHGGTAGGGEADEAEGAGDTALIQRDAGHSHWAQPALAGETHKLLLLNDCMLMCPICAGKPEHSVCFLQHHMSRGSSSGGGGGHWKESPKKNAMNELQDKLMTVRLREAQAQAELREVKLKALQLESQVRHTVHWTHCQPPILAFSKLKKKKN